MERRGAYIGAFLRHMDLPVRTILDAGCGLGWLRRPLLAKLPRARYVGLEASPYLCRRFGWMRGSLVSFRPREPFDLVVCYDVLQYLDDRDARHALENLARLTRGALYFSALTREDWEHYCDQVKTDREVFLRPADWYRRRLARNFDHMGGGIYLRRDIEVMLWELERIEAPGT